MTKNRLIQQKAEDWHENLMQGSKERHAIFVFIIIRGSKVWCRLREQRPACVSGVGKVELASVVSDDDADKKCQKIPIPFFS